MPVRTSPVIVALATICLLVLAPLSISAATYAPAYGMCAQSGDYEPNGVAFTSTGPTACGVSVAVDPDADAHGANKVRDSLTAEPMLRVGSSKRLCRLGL